MLFYRLFKKIMDYQIIFFLINCEEHCYFKTVPKHCGFDSRKTSLKKKKKHDIAYGYKMYYKMYTNAILEQRVLMTVKLFCLFGWHPL